MADVRLASRMNHIEGSGVRRMFDLIRTMEDPINLSIGQADYDAPEPVKEAAIEAIRGGLNRYTVTEGRPALNAAIADRLEQRYGHRPESVFMTSGVSGGLLLSHLALLDPGDEVLLPDPYFVMYKNVLALVGAVPRYYDLYPPVDAGDGRRPWHPDLGQLEREITDRTRVILLNSPSNPTGGMLTGAELDQIGEIARRHDAWIFSDEIYSHFVYDDAMQSMITRMPRYSRILVFGGFSKTFGVPGWRLGFVAGPTDVLEAMKLLQQYTFVCAPAPLQQGALAALELDMSATRDAYRRKRDRVFEVLSSAYKLVPSEGSFYAFPEYPAGMEEASFIAACLEQKLLVVPGSAFSRRATHFRISFAASDAMLERGLEVLRDIAGT